MINEEEIIFPKGEKITNNYFIGNVYLHTLLESENIFNCPMYNVSFEAGARNNWHKHPGGQILLVISGEGYYQEEGKKARLIKKGDTVFIKPNIKHWHGATETSSFSHIAITTNKDKGEAQWLEAVSDEEYSKL